MNEAETVGIEDLATRQLEAYNRSDLDAFCACYHDEVQVWDDLELQLTGLDAFRERYRPLFEQAGFGAVVDTRLVLGEHCVDDERWWRVHPESGERLEGRVLVRYSRRGQRVGVVQFLKDGEV